MKAYGSGSTNPSVASKIIRRLFVTNLPKDYQDVALKDFLTDTINKCVDQEIAQPPITSLIAFKEQGYAVIELQTPEMATACLAMDGIPFEGSSIGVVRPTDFNPDDVPAPVGRPPRLHMEKVGYKAKIGSSAIAEAMSTAAGSDAKCKIFIGDIPAGIEEEQLQLLFSPFGTVKSLTISRDPETHESKGFGYVIYDNADIVPVVCEKLNGIKVCDQSLVVRPAAVKQGPTVVLTGDQAVELDPQIAVQATMDLPDLKTPFINESNKAREAAAKLLKQAGLSTGGQIQKSPPSRIIVLKNMVTRDDLENVEDYLDIKSDIETECSRFGQVLSVVIPRGEDPGVGNVIVEYPSIQQAAGAVVALIGRRFNKHIIRAAFMSETAYANKQYNV